MTSEHQPGEIELWLLDTTSCAPMLAASEAKTARLADDEMAHAAASSDVAEGARWRTGRIALRLLLERHCGTEPRRQPFVRGPGGRPSLAGGGPDFNLADSGTHLLIGISRTSRIGVDLEHSRDIRMSPARIDLLIAAGEGLTGPAADPLQSWTRIEAFAKATGPTLAATLARLGLQGHGEGRLAPADVYRRARECRDTAGLTVADLHLPDGLVGALCHRDARTLDVLRPNSLDAAILRRFAS